MAGIRGRMLGGLLLVLPILITLWVIHWPYTFLEVNIIDPLALFVLWKIRQGQPDTKLPHWFEAYAAPFVAILFALVMLYLLEFIVNSKLRHAFDWIVLRVPVVSIVYNGVRNVFQTLNNQRGQKRPQRVVLIGFPHPLRWVDRPAGGQLLRRRDDTIDHVNNNLHTPDDLPAVGRAVARTIWYDFRRSRRTLFVYEIIFKLAEAWLVVPAIAWIMAVILYQAGHIAISNKDIVAFLLTPLGQGYAAIVATVGLSILFLEQAGIMLLVARTEGGISPTLKLMLRKVPGIFKLGAITAGWLALAIVPFLLLAVLTKQMLLSEHDIYYYLTVRPAAFWQAAGLGVAIAVAAVAVTVWLQVRFVFALPIMLFENQSPRSAMRASRERVRGIGRRTAFTLVGWVIGVSLLGLILDAGFRQLAALVLANVGERPVLLILALLLTQGGIVAMVFFTLIVGLGLIVRRLYLMRNAELGIDISGGWEAALDMNSPISPWSWRLMALTMPLFLIVPLALWVDMDRCVREQPPVRVTAHRGNARTAPENTLAAMQRAIDSRADYVEMDVQLTGDGRAVLLHDRDFRRVSGLSRRLDEMTFAEVRELDVGSWFDPAYANERVPTLEEVIDLCRGKIRLNIELKVFGPNPQLSEAVARIIREKQFEDECLITSLSYDSLVEAKKHNPKLRTGLTVAQALGNVSRLDVDAISVRFDFLTPELQRSAQSQGMEVHAWTINDARTMGQLIKRGIDNIITSDPDLAIRTREEWNNLTCPERLILASRLLLGLEPE